MELDKKSFSIRRHITLVLTLLTVLIVLLIGVCVAVVREQSRIRLTSAADSYLSLLTRTLENQLVIQESYITSQVLNSEELHRLGFGEGHTQAYLDSYKLHTGFSSAMAAGNDVTALYLYSEPNSILMSEYATAQAGRPTETQIQKTNLEETLRSMVDAKTLNDERWTPYVVSGQQYWVRAVHYYGAWLISVVNLDRQCSQATDGMLAFAQPDGVLLAGTRPEEGELSHYISLTAETEGLVLEYYVPSTDMDLDNAMNLALAVGITAVLAAICFVIWYLCSNVVHPLDALVDAMRRISAGDLSVRADWNPVNLELQQVKEAFNVMLNEIETLKIEQYEQKLDAERQEMAALKMQIRPHFFLNNLKLIYALAETGQTQQIQRMILLLSKHLRYVMDYKRETTSLRDETNFCQNYMEMTGIGQKFPPICRVTVSLDLQEMQLPAMTLALQWAGWTWRGVAVWDKVASRPQKGRFRQQSEYIVWGSNGKMPLERNVGCLPGVFRYPNPQNRIHVTEKPLQLMRDVVQICEPGGRILDPFAGAGTTVLAAVQEDYEAVGIEMSDAYFQRSTERLKTALESEVNQN